MNERAIRREKESPCPKPFVAVSGSPYVFPILMYRIRFVVELCRGLSEAGVEP